ncbi:MAG: MFS transporter [Peptococcaceae bacterium]|jgi:MFS family permease|nr:MFS transporter [Peptococcaceae bacterium]
MSLQKLWSKNFLISIIANFFTALVFYLLMTTLAMYSSHTFGVSPSIAGFTASIYVIGALFGRIFTGKYMELIGRRGVVYGSGICFFLATLTYVIPLNLYLLLLIRLVHGVTFGILNTALSTVVVSHIPAEHRGEGIGFFSLSATLATAIGPFIGMFIIQRYPFTYIFWACTLFASCTALLLFFVRIDNLALTPTQVLKIKTQFHFTDFFERRALPISAFVIVAAMCNASVTAFVTSYATELNIGSLSSLFFLVFAVFILLSRPFTGRLLDRRGENIVLIPAILCLAVALLLLSLAHSPATFLLAAVFLALGYGNISSNGQTIAIQSIPEHRVATATSTYCGSIDTGIGLGPVLMGLIVPRFGYDGMYLTGSFIALLSLVIYYTLHGRNAARRAKERKGSV